MTIELNHTIIPARDKIKSARFFARVFGLPFEENEVGHFAPVRVNERLTLDFAQSDSDRVPSHHLAFKVSEDEFEAIIARVRAEGIAYGSGPSSRDN